MKVKFKINPDKKLISTLFKENIEYEDVVRWFDEVYAHPDFSPEYRGIIDMRHMIFGSENRDQPGKMAENTKALAQYMTKLNFTSARWALLVDSPLETCLSMLYANDASLKHPIKIFSTVEAAEDYLCLPLADDIHDLET